MAIRPPQAEAPQQQDPAPKRETSRQDAGPGSLAGNLTRDPELRYTPTGQAVVSMRVAVQDREQDPATGEWRDKPAEYFDVTAWRQLAENCAEHLAKGNRIVAEGRWEVQSWEDKEQVIQTRTVFIATDLGPSIKFIGAKVLARPRKARP